MDSFVLQTPDSGLTSNEILGRIGFAASNESSGGDAIKIAALIKAVAESEFTATSNHTSLVLATATDDTATDKLKITASGHLIPFVSGQYNLGSSSYPFGSVYSDSFIKVGGTSSQYLMADGSVTTSLVTSSIPKRYSVYSNSNIFSSFTTASSYTPSQIDIFQNGVKLHDGVDFTATNGSSVTLTNYAPSGSIIEYIIDMSLAVSSTSTTTTSGPAGFSPSDISGLQLWLDADDSDTITLNSINSSTVSQWNDKSGNGYNVSHGTTTNQPTYQSAVLNSKNVVRFDGNNDRLFNTTAQPVSGSSNRTIFIVFSCNSTSPNDYALFFGSPNGGYGEVFAISQEIGVRVNQGNRIFNQSNNDGSHSFVTFIQNGTNISNVDAWKNGSALSASSTLSRQLNTGAGLYLGSHGDGTAFLSGDIAEIIVYNSALSTSDRESVESYLSTKWGIS